MGNYSKYADTARFAYNWVLGGQWERYKNGGTLCLTE
ncbi:MAG: helix-turn-helix domain-containing protein [Blautia sp.]